nr:MAG TPA: TIP39 peptide [Caudoviricetes sp.]DAP96074.1 MAG TPA: TIP39 peptide [Caudoviricetes sp.]DAR55826.1 MAG TPA: TIP39 peptide [Caudoviricetes sp.]
MFIIILDIGECWSGKTKLREGSACLCGKILMTLYRHLIPITRQRWLNHYVL